MIAKPKIINSLKVQPSSPKVLLISLINNRWLIYEMTKREVVSRYRGSFMGVAWSFISPVLMLLIYTFVFSVVFKSRWGVKQLESNVDFSLMLFSGLIVFNLFAETINRASGLILSNVNYVKKVVFPLEILPIINFGAAFFHAAISFGILLFAIFLLDGFVYWTVIFLPVILIPFALFILSISWVIASLGVFIRDIGQGISLLITLVMFLSPVFYPISAVPEQFQIMLMFNPLSFIIEQVRAVVIFGMPPNWFGLVLYFISATVVLMFGFSWFQKVRKGFADVL